MSVRGGVAPNRASKPATEDVPLLCMPKTTKAVFVFGVDMSPCSQAASLVATSGNSMMRETGQRKRSTRLGDALPRNS